MTNDAKDKPLALDEESGWPVRDTEDDALLDAIAFGRGFYREPMEVFATRDPGKFIGAVESPVEIVEGDGKWLLDNVAEEIRLHELPVGPPHVQAVGLRACSSSWGAYCCDLAAQHDGPHRDGVEGWEWMAEML